MSDFVVIKTHNDALAYVDSLQKKNAEQLSFYPQQTFEREYEKGRIYIALLNNEPCGYIYRGSLKGTVRCHQVCIQYDARLSEYGKALVMCVESDAVAAKSDAIALRCGFDLEANHFWRSLGYKCVDIQQGGIRRNRQINVWRKSLAVELFDDIHIEPASGSTSARHWQKHKQTGLVTQFNRGAKLKQYRAIISGKER